MKFVAHFYELLRSRLTRRSINMRVLLPAPSLPPFPLRSRLLLANFSALQFSALSPLCAYPLTASSALSPPSSLCSIPPATLLPLSLLSLSCSSILLFPISVDNFSSVCYPISSSISINASPRWLVKSVLAPAKNISTADKATPTHTHIRRDESSADTHATPRAHAAWDGPGPGRSSS